MSKYTVPVAAVVALCAASLISAASHGAARLRGPGVAGVPEAAAALRNPYEDQRDAVLAGRKLYSQYCAACHGPEGRGRGTAPRLDDEVTGAAEGSLFWFITNGDLRRGMPAWSGLPAARRWQIVAYLKTLGSKPPE